MSDRSPGRFESVVGNPIARILDPELVIKSATKFAITSTLFILIALLVAILTPSVSGWACIDWACIGLAIVSIVQLIAMTSASRSCPALGWLLGVRW
ncbi:hypothetical protein HJG54_20260 [Leptolyngbya sp. NK1-12]|uniref:Uncharacterized protein n=1 Tax=Leptolyngbya sp. NK1-12 TaxID=2547451 RepID=A0AA96WMA8_9CYAN|nr:hypothetical protein [Leptolyngbya sp. NK1-12]WNZ24951.1 hypothetical protein HJG54_20260 [Leptolyngbya sp. NK1-12]